MSMNQRSCRYCFNKKTGEKGRVLKWLVGTGEMTQGSRELSTLPKDPSVIPSTHV